MQKIAIANTLLGEAEVEKPFFQAHPIFCLIVGAIVLVLLVPKTRNIIMRLLGGVGNTMDQVENFQHSDLAYVLKWGRAIVMGVFYIAGATVIALLSSMPRPWAISLLVVAFLVGVNVYRPRSTPESKKEQGRDINRRTK